MMYRYQVTDCKTAYMTDSLAAARKAKETCCIPEGCAPHRHFVSEMRVRGGRLIWELIDPKGQSLWQDVIRDMEAREAKGLERYGRYLTKDSKEIGLREAYEEALDLVVYLRKAIAELEGE
jgi:hypothetical protein